jgi:hypothetical protein
MILPDESEFFPAFGAALSAEKEEENFAACAS